MPSASPSIFSEFRINFQQSIAGVGRATLLLLEAFSALVSPPFRFKLFFKQMEFIGNKSLWITILTGTFTGMVLTIQSYFALKTFSSESIVGGMVAVSMTRELGPVLTALMVNARAGSAIAAELGTMRVTEQIDALLGDTNVTSSDFNTVKALVQGEINTFMGFQFIVTNRLSKTGNIRSCFAWAEDGLALAIGKDVMARIDERSDKGYATQVYYCMSIGSTRMEEEKVVQIDCDESA